MFLEESKLLTAARKRPSGDQHMRREKVLLL